MIEYTRKLKMKIQPDSQDITHSRHTQKIENFNMNNFTNNETEFLKYMPYSWDGGYILVKKDKKTFKEKLLKVKLIIISAQLVLLFLFALLSYFLAKRALKPMQDAISKLDNFSKDLIHDLNTPITSVLLNVKILENNPAFCDSKPLQRIKRSLDDIGELHKNLNVLLQEDSMQVQKENVFELINEVVLTHKKLYKNISFIVEEYAVYELLNAEAFKQVLTNIISNAAKYNVDDGYVKIYMKERTLYVEDGGIGIQNPQNIFERLYKEHSSGHGIGLDIVKRLCEIMSIKLDASSKLGKGTTIILEFSA